MTTITFNSLGSPKETHEELTRLLEQNVIDDKQYMFAVYGLNNKSIPENCVLIVDGPYPVFASTFNKFFNDRPNVEKLDVKADLLHIIHRICVVLKETID
jgi:hypothetical protein